MKLLPTAAAAVVLSAFGSQNLSAQVVINEVNFTSGDQWIELFNAGTTPVKLGTWSIYHATKTPFRFNDYWWPFPGAAEIKAKEYLRINWGRAIRVPAPAGNLDTGDSSWNFLFGHGFEALDPDQGAIAICGTQDNKSVNNPNIFSDWWQWGDTGFKRESLATGNQPTPLWPVNTAYDKVPAGASMMVLDFLRGFPHQLSSFRDDYSPTPLANNTEGMAIVKENQPCALWRPDVLLESRELAFHGNQDFSVVMRGTRGPAFFEAYFLIFKLENSTAEWGACKQVLSLAFPHVLTGFAATTIGETTVNLPLLAPSAKGATVYMQAVVPSPRDIAFSNHLKVTLSK